MSSACLIHPRLRLYRRTAANRRDVPCVDGSELARAFFTFAALVGAAMCSAFRCGSHDRAPVQFRTWSPILSSCTTPHESTLSPQARRNLPSALRNPLERRRSAIPARGPLEFLDCRRRPQAHQGLTDGAVDVTGAGVRVSAQAPRHAFGEDRPARRLKLRQCSKVEARSASGNVTTRPPSVRWHSPATRCDAGRPETAAGQRRARGMFGPRTTLGIR